jgi:NADH dehydrogenase
LGGAGCAALAWWIWGIAHIYFLIGVRARLSVAINWLWIHMRNQRSARLITQSRMHLDRGGSEDDQGAAAV